jgi:signal transduction histidine kinase
MSKSNQAQINLDSRAIFEALGQGILLFDSEDRLAFSNAMARSILGQNMPLVESEGWSALAMLLDARRLEGLNATDVRAKALKEDEPIRFHALLSGAYTPCWASKLTGNDGSIYTMITLEKPDWTALNELMTIFRNEAGQAVDSTLGHAELIKQVLKKTGGMTVEKLADRVSGFAGIMATQMQHLQQLLGLLQRLEVIRTGQLAEQINRSRKRVKLADFIEDFLEELSTKPIIDPSSTEDLRDRIAAQIPSKTDVNTSPGYFKHILIDLLRNAVLYSTPGSPIIIKATKTQQGSAVQVDVIDQGIGIRAKEGERVFAPFQRARQPQVIAEFGYGLSLYLAKAELEAMGGRIWYESEEGVGSTFSVKLPAWKEESKDTK